MSLPAETVSVLAELSGAYDAHGIDNDDLYRAWHSVVIGSELSIEQVNESLRYFSVLARQILVRRTRRMADRIRKEREK